jgi:hypothetical protein
MILLGLPVWICFSAPFFILVQVESLWGRTPLIWDSFAHFVLDIPDLWFSCCRLGILILLFGSVS